MLMDSFNKWRLDKNNGSALGAEESEDNFSIFYQQDRFTKTPYEIQCDLAYQIYQLQVCVEGLIEEMNS